MLLTGTTVRPPSRPIGADGLASENVSVHLLDGSRGVLALREGDESVALRLQCGEVPLYQRVSKRPSITSGHIHLPNCDR